MICRFLGAVAALSLLSVVAWAAPAPKEVNGKSIAVTWTESVTGRFGNEQLVRNVGRSYQMNIYVSSAGRPFVRVVQSGFGGSYGYALRMPGSRSSDIAPGEPPSTAKEYRVQFEGRSIVVYREFASGAHRIAVDVDGAGTACKASVVNGRQAGNALQRTEGRGPMEISSVQVGAVSCSIREGNVFGQ